MDALENAAVVILGNLIVWLFGLIAFVWHHKYEIFIVIAVWSLNKDVWNTIDRIKNNNRDINFKLDRLLARPSATEDDLRALFDLRADLIRLNHLINSLGLELQEMKTPAEAGAVSGKEVVRPDHLGDIEPPL